MKEVYFAENPFCNGLLVKGNIISTYPAEMLLLAQYDIYR